MPGLLSPFRPVAMAAAPRGIFCSSFFFLRVPAVGHLTWATDGMGFTPADTEDCPPALVHQGVARDQAMRPTVAMQAMQVMIIFCLLRPAGTHSAPPFFWVVVVKKTPNSFFAHWAFSCDQYSRAGIFCQCAVGGNRKNLA